MLLIIPQIIVADWAILTFPVLIGAGWHYLTQGKTTRDVKRNPDGSISSDTVIDNSWETEIKVTEDKIKKQREDKKKK